MNRRLFASALFAVLTACAPTLSSANEAGGIANANFTLGRNGAIKRANEHCARYGKIAHITGENEISNSVRFDCVKP